MTALCRRKQRFAQLTRPWRDRLFGVARHRSDGLEHAEDWVQETMLRAWRDFDGLTDTVAVYAWLLKILDHVIADNLRRDTRRHRLAPVITTDDAILQSQHSGVPGPFEQTLQQQTSDHLLTAVRSLPDDFCRVILLRDIEGLSYREIAQVLEIPQGTVMSRLSRGRRLLATLMIRKEGPEHAPKSGEKRTGAA